MILIAILVLPLIASILCWIAVIGKRVAAPVTLVTCLVLLALAARVAIQENGSRRVVALPGWIEVDGLGVLILLLVSWVAVLACLYSLGYMPRTTHNKSLAAEKFAFQDFPIILATFGLSVAENDR